MRRREFIRLIGATAARPVTASSQEEQMRRVAVLVPLPANDPIFRRNMDTFIAAMKGAGWVEGRKLDIRIISIIGRRKEPGGRGGVLAKSPKACHSRHARCRQGFAPTDQFGFP